MLLYNSAIIYEYKELGIGLVWWKGAEDENIFPFEHFLKIDRSRGAHVGICKIYHVDLLRTVGSTDLYYN